MHESTVGATWAAAAAAAVLAAAAAAGALQAAGPAGDGCEPACAGGALQAAAAVPPPQLPPLPYAAARGAVMSITVALDDDFLVMRKGGVHLRGNIVAHDYDPREGHMFQEIRREPGGPVISKTKIFIKIGANGVWAAQVGSLLLPDEYRPGDYSIRIVTESGLGSPRAQFVVSDRPAPKGGISAPGPPDQAVPPDAPAEIAGIAEILPDAPAEIAGIAEILPDAPAEIAKAVQLDALGDPPGAPADARASSAAPATASPPGAGQYPATVRPVPTHPPGVGPSPRPPDMDPIGYLSDLFTANYLVSLVLSVIISFLVMMAIRAVWRRSRRSRRSRR